MVSATRYATYELLAQKAIRLLIERLKQDFGVIIKCGAELEFYFKPYLYPSESTISKVSHNMADDRRKNYNPYYLKIAPEETNHAYNLLNGKHEVKTGNNYIDRSRYISHFYLDAGSEEVVFTHLGPCNPLRLPGAIETFKKRLVSDNILADKANVSLSPYFAGDIRALHLNISSEGPDIAKVPDFLENLAAVIFETLYLSYNNPKSIDRYCIKHGKNIQTDHGKRVHINGFVWSKEDEREGIEFKHYCPNTNAYLAMASALTSIYTALELCAKGTKTEATLIISDDEFYSLEKFFKKKFENNQHFTTTLNKLSPDGRLGTDLTEACLKAKNLLTPVGNKAVMMK